MSTQRRSSAHRPVIRSRRRLKRAPLLAVAVLGLLLTVPLLTPPAPVSAATTTPTATATATPTATATATPTALPTATALPLESVAPDPSVAPSAAPAPTSTPSPTATRSPSPAPPNTPTPTPTTPPTPTPTATPTPSPTPTPSAPTIDAPADGGFVGGSTTVSGSRDPTQEIQLLSPSGGDPICIVAVDGSADWSCAGVLLPSGPAVQLRVVASGDAGLSASHTVRVLQAPTVTGSPTGQASTSGLVRGTGYPGATVTATLAGGANCSFTVDSSGAWSCLLQGGLISGPEQITASQQSGFSAPASSPASSPLSLQIDVDPPASPVLAAPTAGSTLSLTGSQYYGRGENGATVTVFAGAYSVCTGVVSGGTWSCAGSGVAVGSYALRAVQQDAAGNVSDGSEPIRVRYGAAAATPRPTATSQPTPTPRPSSAVPATQTPTASAPPTTAAPTTPGTPSTSPTPAAPPLGPDDRADGPPQLSVPGGWSDPTQFSTAVIPPWTVAGFPWLQAGLLTLGALLLLLIPARLLAGTVSRARDGRPVFGGHHVAGRNHPREDFEVPPTVQLSQQVIGGAALVAASVFVLLSGPVTSTPNYLRLLLAVVLALALVNAVAMLVPRWWGSRALHLDVAGSILPRYLVLVAVTALASRTLDLHPSLLFGLLGSVAVTTGPLAAQRGRLAAVRAGSLLALGLVGMVVVGTLPPTDGFAGTLAAEFVNTVVLASIGSAALVLIPVGSTSGRRILAWSPPVWAALTVPTYLALFVLLSPTIDGWTGAGSIRLLWLVAVMFAGVSVAAWAWQRFVAPALH